MPSKRTFMDVAIGDAAPQRIMFELDADRVPKTVENFRALCTGEKGMSVSAPDKPLHYKGTIFHRVIDMFMLQSGDFEKGNGTGGESIYGKTFEDENLDASLDKAGLLAMANRGKDTNSSQFFITLDECPHLNGKHTVFGRVVKGMEVVEQIAKVDVDGKDKPLKDVVIVNCGELIKKTALSAVQADPLPTTTSIGESRPRSRSQSPDPTLVKSRSRSPRRRSPSPTPSTSSTASSDSRSRRRRKSKKDKKEKRRSKKDKKGGLKGLVDGYLEGEGKKEETEEELDARLEREENERLDREKKERLEQMKAKLAEEKKQREASGDGAGVVYKGRGSMRYLDPESLASTRGSNGGYQSRDRDGRDYRSSRDRPPHHRDQRDRDIHRERDQPRRSSRSPPPRRSGGGGASGGVEGDWRVGRDMKIRGLDRDDHQDRGLKGRGLSGFERGKNQDEGLDRRAGIDEDKTGDAERSGADLKKEDRVEGDVDIREETSGREQRRGERRGSEESMEMDLDD